MSKSSKCWSWKLYGSRTTCWEKSVKWLLLWQPIWQIASKMVKETPWPLITAPNKLFVAHLPLQWLQCMEINFQIMIHISTLIHVSSVFTIMRSMVALKSDFCSSFDLNFNCIVYMPSYKHRKIHSKAVLSSYPTKHQGRFHISTWILIDRVSVQYNVAKQYLEAWRVAALLGPHTKAQRRCKNKQQN